MTSNEQSATTRTDVAPKGSGNTGAEGTYRFAPHQGGGVCPGCGRCNHCGRGPSFSPYYAPRYPMPSWPHTPTWC